MNQIEELAKAERDRCDVRRLLRFKAQRRTDLINYHLEPMKTFPDRYARITAMCKEQWEKGNRGEEGKWL